MDGYSVRQWGEMRGSDGSRRWFCLIELHPESDAVRQAARDTGVRLLHRLVRDSAGEITGCPVEEKLENPPRLRLEVSGR